MPDITMCMSTTCTQKDSCYRSQAIPSYWQSYSNFNQDENEKCNNYWPMDEMLQLKLKEIKKQEI